MNFYDDDLIFENEYLLIRTSKEKFSDFSEKIQQFILNTKNIHLYQINQKPFFFDCILDNNIYLYTFNSEMEESCLKNGYIPHFCFSGNNIHDKNRLENLFYLLDIDSSVEVFWFPSENDVTENIEPFMDIITQLKLINHPICISFSEIFNQPIHEKSYSFLKKLYSAYSNPLLEKEKELLEYETFSHKNYYINEIISEEVHHIILGIYGDQILNIDYNIDNLLANSQKSLRNINTCLKCENFQYCSERGIGVIIEKNNLKQCLGIALLGN